nr:hypothetical protein [Alienimonas californiensis]
MTSTSLSGICWTVVMPASGRKNVNSWCSVSKSQASTAPSPSRWASTVTPSVASAYFAFCFFAAGLAARAASVSVASPSPQVFRCTLLRYRTAPGTSVLLLAPFRSRLIAVGLFPNAARKS